MSALALFSITNCSDPATAPVNVALALFSTMTWPEPLKFPETVAMSEFARANDPLSVIVSLSALAPV
jgi:hypothetical protein